MVLWKNCLFPEGSLYLSIFRRGLSFFVRVDVSALVGSPIRGLSPFLEALGGVYFQELRQGHYPALVTGGEIVPSPLSHN